jgi:hypothetical protein
MEAARFANKLGYSDVEPFEVIRVVSDKCLEVRPMDAELDPAWKPEWVVGGFAGQCINQSSQKWVIASNAANPVQRIRLQKNGDWKAPSGARFALSGQPIKFYDYNF